MTNLIPDSVIADPIIHKVVFEDEKLRVLEIRVKPGVKIPMHSHPKNILYVINPGHIVFESDKGETKDIKLHSGQVIHSQEPTFHKAENIGDTELFAIQTEFK